MLGPNLEEEVMNRCRYCLKVVREIDIKYSGAVRYDDGTMGCIACEAAIAKAKEKP